MVYNCTHGFWVFQGSSGLWCVLVLIVLFLLLSFCCNILCGVHKHVTDRGGTFLSRTRMSLKNREMEENPIYGNITYTHTHRDDKQEVETPAKLSSVRECYANLSLKGAKSRSRASPLDNIQYSDVLVPCEEEEKQDDKDSCSGLSELYASVDAEHIKNKKEQSDEPYANHV